MIEVKSVRHTGLRVSDVAQARDFYSRLLGLAEIPRPDVRGVPGAWLECDGMQIHLIGAIEEGARVPAIASGPHIALQVADIGAARAALGTAGVAFEEFTAMGNTVLFVRDPDGNVIELREAP